MKGTFVDGHECDDVVEYHQKFLRRMVSLGFLNSNNAPTEEAKASLPVDISTPLSEVIDNTVVLFHVETRFQANEDQTTVWAPKGTKVIRLKSKGSGIMISDFICEQSGYLSLSDDEYERARSYNQEICKAVARVRRSERGILDIRKFYEANKGCS